MLVNAGLLVAIIIGVRAWQADGRPPPVAVERAPPTDGGAPPAETADAGVP